MSGVLQGLNLEVGYDGFSIGGPYSFELNEGEVVALMGKNGCGKSTFIKTLSGLLESVSGELLINGNNINDLSVSELARKIAFVLTSFPDSLSLTVYEVITLGRAPYTNFWGSVSVDDSRFIEDALNKFDLTELKSTSFNKLSDGQKQRVLIARAWAQNTKVLILDEPTTYLDIPTRLSIMEKVRDLAVIENKVVLFSTHDWDIVSHLKNPIWLMKQDGIEVLDQSINYSDLLVKLT